MMTNEEHILMVMMFARIHEAIGTIQKTLESRGIWTDDDAIAFSHATHYDPKNLEHYMDAATDDYLQYAAAVGVVTGLEPKPPSA